jgi:hypothetical protein
MRKVDVWRTVGAGCALLAAALALVPRTPASPGSLTYQKRRAAGVPVHVITLNLNDPGVKVSVALARGQVGRFESFGGMLRRTRPAAALTGTFFSRRTAWPTGEIVIDGQRVAAGRVGTVVAITPENTVRFLRFRRGGARRWRDYDMVLGGGPRLLTAGRITLAPRAEGFRDRGLYRRRPRTAVGVTRSGKLLFVSIRRPVYLRRLARVMRTLGARDAVAMDGGSSTAMFYRGRFVSRPSRRLTNILVAYDNTRAYAHARPRLAAYARLARHSPREEMPEQIAAPAPDAAAISAKEIVVEEDQSLEEQGDEEEGAIE